MAEYPNDPAALWSERCAGTPVAGSVERTAASETAAPPVTTDAESSAEASTPAEAYPIAAVATHRPETAGPAASSAPERSPAAASSSAPVTARSPASTTATTPAPAPSILIAGHFDVPYGYSTYRPNGTRDWLITFTLSGRGCYRLDGEELVCGEGDVVLLPPGTPHDYATPEGEIWQFVWVHFVPEPNWADLLRWPARLGRIMAAHIAERALRDRLFRTFRRLIADSLTVDHLHGRLALNAMEEILLLVARSLARNRERPPDPRIADILAYMTEHMKEPLTIG